MNVLPRLVVALAWAALFAGLVMPTPTPELANTVTLTLMGVGLLVLIMVPVSRVVLRQPAIVAAGVAGIVLLLALSLTATSFTHIVVIMVLAPLWLAGAHAGLLTRLGQRLTPLVIASFALLGTAAGAAITTYGAVFLQLDRGGFLVNNPIHLADLSLMLGFVALVGLLDRRPVRFVFLLGPALALTAVWFSGSRGPLLAFVPMLIVAAAIIAFVRLPRRQALTAVVGVIVLIALAGTAVVGLGLGGRLGGLGESAMALLEGNTTDGAISERLYMDISAWNAFLASPLHGYGMIDYTVSAARFAPPGPAFPPSGHLHSDIADFAVIGGLLGLLSYALLLAAPILGGLATRGANQHAAIYLGAVTSVGYFGMGLTNAMFGILTQTAVYGVILALIAALAQQGQGAAD